MRLRKAPRGLMVLGLVITATATAAWAQPAAQEPPPPAKSSPPSKGPNLIRPAPRSERKTPVQVFNPGTDVRAAIEEKSRAAAADQRRVLVIWGDNANPWSEAMLKSMLLPDIAAATLLHYEVLWADVGDSTIGPLNIALAQTYGVNPPPKAGDPPLMTIIESQGAEAGKVVVSRAGLVLADQRKLKAGQKGYNQLALEDFLLGGKPPPIVAATVVEQAQAQAESRTVPVMLVFDEVPDGWCVRFRQWLAKPAAKDTLNKHFEVVRMDLSRMAEVFKMYESMGGEKSQSSPWCVFTDAEGKRLAPATDGSEDFGFPTGDEIPKFAALLRRVAPAMTADEAKAIEASLKAEVEAMPK